MTKNEIDALGTTTFAPGFKGMFSIYPFRKIIKEWEFILALVVSVLIGIFLGVKPDIALEFIEIILEMILLTIPSILGISVAGFSIIVTLVNDQVLKKIAKIRTSENKPKCSFYQKTNTIFAMTVLAQAVCLLDSIILKCSMPFSLKIVVCPLTAQITNAIVGALLTLLFGYSLLILISLIKNIFTLGQTVNRIFLNNESETENLK